MSCANDSGLGIRIFVGSEVDILKDGSLDYSDEILTQLEVVVCSVHSYMNLDSSAMTERMLAACTLSEVRNRLTVHIQGKQSAKRCPRAPAPPTADKADDGIELF